MNASESKEHRCREIPELGAMLRCFRERRFWTQAALAERAQLPEKTVSSLERGARRRPHLTTLEMLADALDLDAGDRAALWATRAGQPSPSTPLLPLPATSFLGRDDHVRRVLTLLSRPEVRLLTLTGTGGIGKTRLALRVAEESGGNYPDGVFFVDLSSIRDAALVPSSIAQVFGVQTTSSQSVESTLVDYCTDRHMLVVLDNLEQILPAATFIDLLMASSPGLRVLATSRERLALAREHLFIVGGMTLPGRTASLDLELAELSEAIQLFVLRAQAVQSSFELNDSNLADVVQICTALDGIPLAIELAAARMLDIGSPRYLRQRLDQRLAWLTSGLRDQVDRHRTMRAAIDWSYDGLNPIDQVTFRRLSVFSGGFTIDAAEAMIDFFAQTSMTAGDSTLPPPALDQITSLVDKNLIQIYDSPDGGTRFRMLETVREFAQERLRSSNEENQTRQWLLTYLVERAKLAEIELMGPDQADWLDEVMSELENLRSAFNWALNAQDATAALSLGTSLWRFWTGRGLRREGTEWLERAIELDVSAHPALQAKAFYRLGTFAIDQSDYEEARSRLEESLTIQRGLGNQGDVADVLDALGIVDFESGEIANARALCEEAYEIRRIHVPDDRRGLALSLFNLADLTREEGAYTTASDLYQQALAIWNELGDQSTVAFILLAHGINSRLAGNTRLAHQLTSSALKSFRELRDDYGTCATLAELGRQALLNGQIARAAAAFVEVLDASTRSDTEGDMIHNWVEAIEGLAWIALRAGDSEGAARMLGAAAATRGDRSLPFPSRADGEAHDRQIALLRHGTGDAWRANWRAGQLMTVHEVEITAMEVVNLLADDS